MTALPDIKLISCVNCDNFIREDAAYCWSCLSEPSEIRNCFAPFSRVRLSNAADREQHERSLARFAFMLLGLTDAPCWADLLEPKFHLLNQGLSNAEVQDSIVQWQSNKPSGNLTPYRQPGWLKSLIDQFKPEGDQLEAVLTAVHVLEKNNSSLPTQSAPDKERFFSDILSAIEQFRLSRPLNEMERLALFNGRKRIANNLRDLLAAADRTSSLNEWADWNRDAELRLCRRFLQDSSGAFYYYPGPDPDNPVNWVLIGFNCSQEQKHLAALIWFLRKKFFDEQMQAEPDAIVLGYVGKSLVGLNRVEEAEPFLRNSLNLWRKTSDRRVAEFEALDIPGQAPPEYLPHIRLAICKVKLNHADEADSFFQKAIQLLDGNGSESDSFTTDPQWLEIFDFGRKQAFIFALREYARFLENQHRLSDAASIRDRLKSVDETTIAKMMMP